MWCVRVWIVHVVSEGEDSVFGVRRYVMGIVCGDVCIKGWVVCGVRGWGVCSVQGWIVCVVIRIRGWAMSAW